MLSPHSVFTEPHHHSLELSAVQALARGDAVTAFRLADRRCRVAPPPEAYSFVLRAEASFRMGDRTAALADLTQALRLAPDDVAANRRMLRWAKGRPQLRAAKALIGSEHDPAILHSAIAVVHRHDGSAIANLTVLHDTIEGWAVWGNHDALELTIEDGDETKTRIIERDPGHPFGAFGQAASFRLPRPQSSKPQSITLSAAGHLLSSQWVAANSRSSSIFCLERPGPARSNEPITVVVPVYGNHSATKACLTSLLAALRPAHRVLLVNDATPDRRIANYLGEISTNRSVILLRNPRNRGFVASVNRALAQLPAGDVLLLNADTIVPPDLVDRLAAIARSASDIGTVMPLSNNGDLASFPIPYQSNPLGTSADIATIDAIASKANPGALVDIPNGVGFCMYITRRCIDAVGFLSEDFHRGYLEDVDFCLRARALGFRNVCAPSIYVGHAGGESFGSEKRSLVVHNLDILTARFPNYRAEFAAFDLADPLRPFREAIERQLAPDHASHRLLITGPGVLAAIARERASEIASKREPVLILELQFGNGTPFVNISEASGCSPQSVRFAFASSNDRAALHGYLAQFKLSGAEIFDAARVPPELVEILRGLRVRFDLFLADAGAFGPDDRLAVAAARPAARSAVGVVPDARAESRERARDRGSLIDAAERILVPCRHAQAFAEARLGERQLDKLVRLAAPPRRPSLRRPPRARHRMGILPLQSGAHEYRLIDRVARAFRIERPEVSLTVIGATVDDLGLMRIGNTFVTGVVGTADFARVVNAHALQCLFVSVCRPLFGQQLQLHAFNSPLPVAYFDWSEGRAATRRNDLAIDPGATVDGIISALRGWMAE